jgi:cytochrome P450
MLAALRSDANWAFLRPKRTRLRQRFYDRLNGHLARAEPGNLAGEMAVTPTTGRTAPAQQVPQWLFAFDAAGIATFRALALLASHPDQAGRALGAIRGGEGHKPPVLPYLRACVLESVRLWPTTPMLLRQTTRYTVWESGVMPAGTSVLIFVPYFHRDDRRLAYADRFSSELWLEERSTADWPLVPFSGGPVTCPGQNLVLLLVSTVLASLLDVHRFALQGPTRLNARRPLPATLHHFALRFVLDA